MKTMSRRTKQDNVAAVHTPGSVSGGENPSGSVHVRMSGASRHSTETSYGGSEKQWVSYIKDSCNDLIQEFQAFIPQMKSLLNMVSTAASAKPDIGTKIHYVYNFITAWDSFQAKIQEHWQMQINHVSGDVLCTVKGHRETTTECQFRFNIDTSDTETVNILRKLGLAQPIPRAPGQKLSTDEIFEINYFSSNWIHITDIILQYLSKDMKTFAIEKPDEMKSLTEKWQQHAPLFQITWKLAADSDWYRRPVPERCLYLNDEVAACRKEEPTQPNDTPEQMETDGDYIMVDNNPRSSGSTETHTNGGTKDAAISNLQQARATLQSATSTAMTSSQGQNQHGEGAKGRVGAERDRSPDGDKVTLKQQVQYYVAENEDLKKKYDELTVSHDAFRKTFDLKVEQVDESRSEVQRFKRENERLREAFHTLQNNYHQLERSLKESQTQFTQQLKQYEREYRQHIQGRDQENAGLRKQNNSQHEEIRQLREAKDALLNNMSAMMNQQMSRDESDLENINVKNRPMKIMEEFHMFCSQEWLEAKSTLDEWAEENRREDTEAEMCDFVTMAMLKCYGTMEQLHMSTYGVFLDLLNSPLQPYTLQMVTKAMHWDPPVGEQAAITTFEDHKPKKLTYEKLNVDLKVQIAKCLKTSSDNLNFNNMAKEHLLNQLQSAFGTDIEDTLVSNKSLVDYYETCLKICWKMMLQQPAMKFECDPSPGGKYDENKHELHFGSADPNNPKAVVHYYVHPALFHGNKQMKKARVVLHIPPKQPAPEQSAVTVRDHGESGGGGDGRKQRPGSHTEVAEEAIDVLGSGGQHRGASASAMNSNTNAQAMDTTQNQRPIMDDYKNNSNHGDQPPLNRQGFHRPDQYGRQNSVGSGDMDRQQVHSHPLDDQHGQHHESADQRRDSQQRESTHSQDMPPDLLNAPDQQHIPRSQVSRQGSSHTGDGSVRRQNSKDYQQQRYDNQR